MTTKLTARDFAQSFYEAQLVELPTLNLFASLGWSTANLYHEVIGSQDSEGSEGRESEHEVILRPRLLAALKKLNPGLADDAYAQAIEQLTADRSTKLPVQANREFYELLRNRVRVRVTDGNGNPEEVLLAVIDWNNPQANDFFLAQQFRVSGDMYRRRCDMIGFVNGIPLLLIELKRSSVATRSAFHDNLTDYKAAVPQLFVPNALVLLSNGSDTKIGSITSAWEHFFEWKRINDEGEQGEVSLETAVRGICDKTRFLDLLENFVFYEEVRGGLAKKIAKNHQYLGVNRAIAQVKRLRENQGRLGVFWHTQGSGKSLSMAFFAEKIHRTMPGNWTFLIITDRDELDDQISGTFKRLGIVPKQLEIRATSGAHLKELLQGNHRYIFSLIQKFHTEPGQIYPPLSARSDIIVITDEAHRSQYDIFALNMRSALPNAAFIGFTGTPLVVGEERTKEVFGDYVSVYNFAQSVEDGATVPLYYENRIPELQLTNENLNADMERLLEDAELDEDQEKRLEREFGRQYHLITRDERLEIIAADLVTHFTGRGYRGKAMMVCIDKATAVRMYDKVQKCWAAELEILKAKLLMAKPAKPGEALYEKIALMESTDMAVVVSQGQNEQEELRQKGLDIAPHRKRMVTEDLDEKFKNPDDPLRLVFVCAMWITGFDVPTCSTIYLDKPMKNHTLMQTIARANRVAPGKASGLIVDYVGIFRSLQDALAIYARSTASGIADVPIKDKTELVKALAERIASIAAFCEQRGVKLDAISQAEGYSRIGMIDQAVDTLIVLEGDKKQFLAEANHVARLYRAILPDADANNLAAHTVLISFLAAKIRSLEPPPDISAVMSDVEQLLNDSIATEGYQIAGTTQPEPLINLSEIDFAALDKKFADGKKHSEAEKLKRLISFNLARLIAINRSRIDFMEKFQQLIDEYNAGSRNIESFFHELKNFARNLSAEEQRTIAENLSEEELAIFDILTRPEPPLTDKERESVKKVAREMIAKLKAERLVIDWRQKAQARAAVQQTIREFYLNLPTPPYTRELKQLKRELTFGHIYDSYAGAGRSVYQNAGPLA